MIISEKIYEDNTIEKIHLVDVNRDISVGTVLYCKNGNTVTIKDISHHKCGYEVKIEYKGKFYIRQFDSVYNVSLFYSEYDPLKEYYNFWGYNDKGLDARGIDRNGIGMNGLDIRGYDSDPFNWRGFDWDGFDRDGFDRDGYNSSGLTRSGLYNPDKNRCIESLRINEVKAKYAKTTREELLNRPALEEKYAKMTLEESANDYDEYDDGYQHEEASERNYRTIAEIQDENYAYFNNNYEEYDDLNETYKWSGDDVCYDTYHFDGDGISSAPL